MARFETVRNAGLGAVLAAAIMSFGATGALAQTASPAPAAPAPAASPSPAAPAAPTTTAASTPTGGACFQAPAALSPDEVASFLSNPPALLSTYPTGGLPLATRARALAGSNINSIDALISLAATGNKDQKAAIGAGLARAARACVASNPQYAAEIQQKVAASNLADVVTAFLAASNDVQTAALGGAGGAAGGGAGGAGGIGGGGASNGGSGGAAGDTATPTGAETFGAGGGGGGGTSRTTNTTNQNFISPTSL